MPCSAARLAPFAVLLALATAAAAQPQVPDAPCVDSSDTYFVTVVEDPYRWLEHYDQPEVRAWYAAEEADGRAEWLYTLRSYAEAGGHLVALKRLPDAQSATLYVRDAFSGERLLLAPERVAPGAVLREFLLSRRARSLLSRRPLPATSGLRSGPSSKPRRGAWTITTATETAFHETIRLHGPLSRADVAWRTRLTAQTVSNLVCELLEAGLVVEAERRRQGRGASPRDGCSASASAFRGRWCRRAAARTRTS